MAIKQTQPKFVASDGREFDTTEAAEKHEKLSVAENEFKAAKQKFHRIVAAAQLTKDGHAFDFGTHYFITEGYNRQMPEIIEVYFTMGYLSHNCRLDGEKDKFVLVQQVEGREKKYPIDELYWSKEAALVALIKVQRAWLLEEAKWVEQNADRWGVRAEVKSDG